MAPWLSQTSSIKWIFFLLRVLISFSLSSLESLSKFKQRLFSSTSNIQGLQPEATIELIVATKVYVEVIIISSLFGFKLLKAKNRPELPEFTLIVYL